MFGWLAKRTEAYKALEESVRELSNENAQHLDRIDLLEKNIEEIMEKVKTGGMFVEDGNSSVVLEIDNELKVGIKSRINKEITNTLIDDGYITSAQSEDESAINFAFILIANEATEQVITNINTDETN